MGIRVAKEGLEINTKALGPKHPAVAESSKLLGDLFLLDGNVLQGLKLYQSSLAASCIDFDEPDFSANPGLAQIRFTPEAFFTLKNKAATLASCFYKEGMGLDYLRASFDTYQLTLDLIHKNRVSFPEFESKIWVSGAERETYEGAVSVAYEMYRQTGDLRYKHKTFEFSEQGKAAALFASIQEKRALQAGGIPDSLLEKENYYSERIEALENRLMTEKLKPSPDKRQVETTEGNIFLLKNEQAKLTAFLERSFPNYHRLKYNNTVVGVNELRSTMRDGQVIVEYTFTGDKIMIFAVAPERFEIYRINKPADFDSLLSGLRTYLDELSFICQTPGVYENFLSSSHKLYQLLLGPVSKLVGERNLTIIPDEKLATIPFEVLLTESVDPETEYGFLPYLISKNAVGYAYSANLLHYNADKGGDSRLSMAAFAPSYSDLPDDEPGSPTFRYRSFLKPLPFAQEEAKMVSRVFRGDVFNNKDACESHFKKVAGRYDVLHLSMHAIVDDQNPMYSNLAFGKDRTKGEDGYLNTFELLNMKLNARLAVLSACNTGVGALQKGEGIMSLARGFYYAGCPDVVMTLWPVEDELSSSLVNDFYHYLSEGKNKVEALQLAKLNFLRSADPLRAHPYFWAGYVNIGDASPLIDEQQEKRPGGSVAWASILGLLIVLLPFAWKLF